MMREVVENIGAGEGNRTLVFSLEGFRRLNTFNVRSDKSSRKAPLRANGFSSLSEREHFGRLAAVAAKEALHAGIA